MNWSTYTYRHFLPLNVSVLIEKTHASLLSQMMNHLSIFSGAWTTYLLNKSILLSTAY